MKSIKNKNLVHALVTMVPSLLSGSLQCGGRMRRGPNFQFNQKRLRVLFLSIGMCCLSCAVFASTNQTPEDQILSKGFAAYMDGRDRQAQSYFEEVIRINPKNSSALKGLDKVKIRLKKIEDEKKAKALELAKAKVKEGDQLKKTNDLVGAIDSYHAAVDAVPGYKPAEHALKDIRRQMEKETKNRRLKLSIFAYNRGVLAYLERDWAKAYRIWSERSALDPNNVQLTNATLRAETNFRKMMITERTDFFRRGARAFFEQGLYEQAKNSWVKVLELEADDLEALEGKARAENAILDAQGKGRDSQISTLLEQALDYYAQQSWRKSLDTFQQIARIDPNFTTAQEYISKLNDRLSSMPYVPNSGSGQNWKPEQSSQEGSSPSLDMPDSVENVSARKAELESQKTRDPSNIRIQQELDKVVKLQNEEADRIYKDGLIAYSQGNRTLAIQKWKQVLVINGDHKKAQAALKKALAEEQRTGQSVEEE